jgi:hypothetical protein
LQGLGALALQELRAGEEPPQSPNEALFPGAEDTHLRLRVPIRTLRVRIQTATDAFVRDAPFEAGRPIWLLGFETMRQLESPQWLASRGFQKVSRCA